MGITDNIDFHDWKFWVVVVLVIGVIVTVIVVVWKKPWRKSKTTFIPYQEGFVDEAFVNESFENDREGYIGSNDFTDQFKYAESYVNSVIGV